MVQRRDRPNRLGRRSGGSRGPPGTGDRAETAMKGRELRLAEPYAHCLSGNATVAPGALEVTLQRDDDTLVLALAGELDLATASLLGDVFDQIERDPATRLVLDLSGLSSIDSTGVRLIVSAQQRRVDRQYSWLEIRPGPRSVQRVFQLTMLDEILSFVTDA